MKLTATAAIALLTSTLAFGPWATNSGTSVAQTDPHAGHAQAETVIEGSQTPSLIRDTVAYESFFRSLVFAPEEADLAVGRVAALAVELDVSAEKAEAVRAVAEDLARALQPLDAQATAIKDSKHLPNLNAADASQLAGLQQRKEAIINSTAAGLDRRLGREAAEKVRQYVERDVKPRVRSFRAAAPRVERGAGPAEGAYFLSAGYSPAQTYNGVGMNGYGHLYVSSWSDDSQARASARSQVTEDYNNYGHRWSVETKITSPGGTRVASNRVEWYAAPTNSTSQLDFGLEDGPFDVDVILRQSCPFIYGYILSQFLQNPPLNVPPFILISGIVFTKNPVARTNDSTVMNVQLTASTTAAPRVTIEAFQNTNADGIKLFIEPAEGLVARDMSAGVTLFPFRLSTPTAETSPSGLVTYRARVGNNSNSQVRNLTPEAGVVSPPLCVGSSFGGSPPVCQP